VHALADSMQRSQTETDAAEARRQRESEAAAAAAREAAALAANRARQDRMHADRSALDAQNAALQRIQVGQSSSVSARARGSSPPDSDGNIVPHGGADEEEDGGRDDASIASVSSFGDEMSVHPAQRSMRAPILFSRPLPPQRSLAAIDASLLFGNHQMSAHSGAASSSSPFSSSSAMGPASFVDLTIGMMPRSRAQQEASPETQPGE
jgi:hypothetical protein